MSNQRIRVLDARGRELTPCDAARADKLVAAGRALRLAGAPATIQLPYEVEVPAPSRPPAEPPVAPGTPLLLHICCGPCATYPVPHLRERGYDVLGWWYNPNIEPAGEHALREESARGYATRVGLRLEAGTYEPERYEEAVRGHTERPERCLACYRLRLQQAAHEATRRGIDTFTTTLLISPYQDQAALRRIGEEVAGRHGLHFHFENLRQGWAERGRLAREYGLYLQQYCGCHFSLAERARAQERPAVRAGEEG